METHNAASVIRRVVGLDVMVKEPLHCRDPASQAAAERRVRLENSIFEKIGGHAYLIKYIGRLRGGIMFKDASEGDLEYYLFENTALVTPRRRVEWCRQATEVIAFLHQNNIVHGDLRLPNFLLHETEPGQVDLQISGFGNLGPREMSLEVDGPWPDGPTLRNLMMQGSRYRPSYDVFGLAYFIYTVMTGEEPNFEPREEPASDSPAAGLYLRYPKLPELKAEHIIMGCLTLKYTSVQDVLDALNELFPPWDYDEPEIYKTPQPTAE